MRQLTHQAKAKSPSGTVGFTCRQKLCGPQTEWYCSPGSGPFSWHVWSPPTPSGWCGRSWSKWLRPTSRQDKGRLPCCTLHDHWGHTKHVVRKAWRRKIWKRVQFDTTLSQHKEKWEQMSSKGSNRVIQIKAWLCRKFTLSHTWSWDCRRGTWVKSAWSPPLRASASRWESWADSGRKMYSRLENKFSDLFFH